MTGQPKLLLVGCGKMGGALLKRVIEQGVASAICVVEPSAPSPDIKIPASVSWLASPDQLPVAFVPDIVVFAVKPQSIADVVPAYARFKNCVFVSIAAGITLARLHNVLGDSAIVRAMPNLPASIGKGMTVAVANIHVHVDQHAVADALLKTVGDLAWIDNESWIDAVTALSGSGPAYVFALCEAMTAGGEELGLPHGLAAQLARATLTGCGALLEQSTETAEALRRAVTSPGGTTEAALKHLLASGGMPDILLKAMTAAADRAKELAK